MTSKVDQAAADALARRAQELIAIGQEMLAEASCLGATAAKPIVDRGADGNYPKLDGQSLEAKALALYNGRRMRDALFASQLFGEPAWDILLDLFIAGRRGRKLQVTAVCIGASVPITTGLRYVKQLEAIGLIDREGDPSDHRRVNLALTPLGVNRMASFLEMSDGFPTSKPKPSPNLTLATVGGKPEPFER